MQLGFVGLGKMGGNMVHRIHRDSDHQVVAFDFSDDAVKTAEGHGATGAGSLEELVSKLEAPRTVWVMVPAGEPTEETVKTLGELLDAGDTIVDGGNTNWSTAATPTGTTTSAVRASWTRSASTTSTSAPPAACGAWRSATA
jgi:6-phosphogluconate dehydrogenase